MCVCVYVRDERERERAYIYIHAHHTVKKKNAKVQFLKKFTEFTEGLNRVER